MARKGAMSLDEIHSGVRKMASVTGKRRVSVFKADYDKLVREAKKFKKPVSASGNPMVDGIEVYAFSEDREAVE